MLVRVLTQSSSLRCWTNVDGSFQQQRWKPKGREFQDSAQSSGCGLFRHTWWYKIFLSYKHTEESCPALPLGRAPSDCMMNSTQATPAILLPFWRPASGLCNALPAPPTPTPLLTISAILPDGGRNSPPKDIFLADVASTFFLTHSLPNSCWSWARNDLPWPPLPQTKQTQPLSERD